MKAGTSFERHDAGLRRYPGEAGLWVLICGDLMVFSAFFLIFASFRGWNEPLYTSSQALLSRGSGLLNTIWLLTSSFFVAAAVHSARQGGVAGRKVPMLLIFAIACGLGFMITKLVEYDHKIREGLTVSTNQFFQFYYMYTGIHFFHVTIGMGLLIWMWAVSRKPALSPAGLRLLESGGVFWHLVDLLWIFLFALFYVVS